MMVARGVRNRQPAVAGGRVQEESVGAGGAAAAASMAPTGVSIIDLEDLRPRRRRR